MSNTTPNLNLFKYDVTTDSNVPFSITTALNNNWDKIDTEINLKANKTEVLNKADVDLTNVNQIGKNNIMAWGMPDLTATPLPVYDNTNFTTSYDGFLQGNVCCGVDAGSTFIDFFNSKGVLIESFLYGYSNNHLDKYNVTIPVSKGTTIKIRPTWSSFVWRNGKQVNGQLSFYPLKGVN